MQDITIVNWEFVGDEESFFEQLDRLFGGGEIDDEINSDLITDTLSMLHIDIKFLLKIPIFKKYYDSKSGLNEVATKNPEIKITKEIADYVSKFSTDEELLRSGGLPIELLDRAAFGFSADDVKTLMPDQLKIRWRNDLENVKWEIKNKKITDQQYAKAVDLRTPIDVDYSEDLKMGFKRGFYLQDGHHRYYAAKILNKPLNVNLTIKINPLLELAPHLSYDDFHRTIFKQIKGQK